MGELLQACGLGYLSSTWHAAQGTVAGGMGPSLAHYTISFVLRVLSALCHCCLLPFSFPRCPPPALAGYGRTVMRALCAALFRRDRSGNAPKRLWASDFTAYSVLQYAVATRRPEAGQQRRPGAQSRLSRASLAKLQKGI